MPQIKSVLIDKDLLTRWMTTGAEMCRRCVEGLPKGAILTSVTVRDRTTLHLIFYHPSFEDVDVDDVPELRPLYEHIEAASDARS